MACFGLDKPQAASKQFGNETHSGNFVVPNGSHVVVPSNSCYIFWNGSKVVVEQGGNLIVEGVLLFVEVEDWHANKNPPEHWYANKWNTSYIPGYTGGQGPD